MEVPSNTVLDLAHPNHLREALMSRRMGLGVEEGLLRLRNELNTRPPHSDVHGA